VPDFHLHSKKLTFSCANGEQSFGQKRELLIKETPVNAKTNLTDFDVIRRAQQGDADAFAALFHTHKVRIYSLCLRITNNAAEAEDLTQDAFLQVFRKLPTFRGDSALSTWLYRIAVNTVLMHFRKKTLRQLSLDQPYEHEGKLVRREYGTRDGRLASSADRISLTQAIKELPDGYRTIFLLHEVDGYEHREIAELLDCSVGNSKSQLHKAKLRIRQFLSTRQAGSSAAARLRARSQPTARITIAVPGPVPARSPMSQWAATGA
jgi:RNA polymerase sigma-70 factor (ECF subfamily)